MFTQLRVESPVVIGHSLGGLVAFDFASAYPDHVAAAVVIDSPLLPGGNRAEVVRDLVAGLRGGIRTRLFAAILRGCSVPMTMLLPGRGSSIRPC